jgi:hypothetical protein
LTVVVPVVVAVVVVFCPSDGEPEADVAEAEAEEEDERGGFLLDSTNGTTQTLIGYSAKLDFSKEMSRIS